MSGKASGVRVYRVGVRGELILRADGKGERFARRAALNIIAASLESEFEVEKVSRVRALEDKVSRVEAKTRDAARRALVAARNGGAKVLPAEDSAPAPEACCEEHGPCPMRRKVQLVPRVLPMDACGVPDSAMVDFLDDESSPTGKPMLVMRACPWCGGPWLRTGESWEKPDDDDGEAWKNGQPSGGES